MVDQQCGLYESCVVRGTTHTVPENPDAGLPTELMVTNSICVQAFKNEAPGARTAESAPNSTPASLTELSQ